MPIFSFYIVKNDFICPSMGVTADGIFREIEPVSIGSIRDQSAVFEAINKSLSLGNPVVPGFQRNTSIKPVVMEYAKVKSWATFAKSVTAYWKIKVADNSDSLLCPTIRSESGGWIDDPANSVRFPHGLMNQELAAQIASIICRNEL